MDATAQIEGIRNAKIAAEKAKMKTAQGKRMVPFLIGIDHLLEDLQTPLVEASEAAPVTMEQVADMLATLTKCKEVVAEEMRLQKIADKGGQLGWKAVKEYEGPDFGKYMLK